MSYYAYGFEAEIASLHYEPYSYTVLFVPERFETILPFDRHPRLRVEGEIAEHSFNAALIPANQGRHIILSPDFLKAAGLRRGDVVEVRFNIADQDGVEVPEELEAALYETPGAREAWDALTPGRRRGLAYLVGKPKSAEARQRKAAAIVTDLMAGTLPVPGHRKRP